MKPSSEDKPKIMVNSEGQTVASARDLLDSPRVKKFIQDFRPQAQAAIQLNLITSAPKKVKAG